MIRLPTDKIISCFYDSSEDCVKVIDPDGILMSFNPNGLTAMEIDDPKKVIGREWLQFWQGNMHDIAAKALDTAKSGRVAQFEGYCPTFKGTMKYWDVTIAPLFNDHGEIQWMLINSRDATKRKELEKEVTTLRQKVCELESSRAN